MKSKRRRKPRKKNYGLLLPLKLALVCYLAIFGVGYLTSNTSAYLTSQAEISQTITADVSAILMNQCGEEIEKDVVTSEEIEEDCVDKDLVELDAASSDVGCKGEDDKLLGENKLDVVSSEKIEVDCKNIDDESKGTVEVENAAKENENNADLDANKGKEQQKPENGDQEQPDGQDDSVIESTEKKLDDKGSVESKAPENSAETKKDDEINAVVTPVINTKIAEGDTNEREKVNEKEENNEVDK
ncbi:SipW-dependent-type signal peptide-containing protein [Sporosarcina sp. E16_8]|uniref:SipW-dependent-type signal peptide-containing protein n=1 Tax=Sporosarcina sp. E16_8 TaxID=2789295 RepID=UPI001A9286FE|nr:SipW-dependent-type signal peptide-containing protein [Sporosarcina sp. E16_8]MBO0588885.1 hypothetical protein [Sporosarcina sp. E16_8]